MCRSATPALCPGPLSLPWVHAVHDAPAVAGRSRAESGDRPGPARLGDRRGWPRERVRHRPRRARDLPDRVPVDRAPAQRRDGGDPAPRAQAPDAAADRDRRRGVVLLPLLLSLVGYGELSTPCPPRSSGAADPGVHRAGGAQPRRDRRPGPAHRRVRRLPGPDLPGAGDRVRGAGDRSLRRDRAVGRGGAQARDPGGPVPALQRADPGIR